MGSMPRLPKKTELNYRKGSTNESQNCKHCLNIVKSYDGYPGAGARCRIMGLNASNRYRVREDHTCNAHVLDKESCWWLKKGRGVGP